MRITIKKIYKHMVPLCQNGDYLLCYSHGKVNVIDIKTNKITMKTFLPVDKMRVLMSYSSILARRFGLTGIVGAMIDDYRSILCYRRELYIYDWNSNMISKIDSNNVAGANGRILHFSKIKRGVAWGDYGYNPEKNRMGIYYYDADENTVKKCWQFECGDVNHIHNIIEDTETTRIWILTGDFDDSAAIYYTEDFFETLICAARGSQINRACIGISINNILYYASDSSNEDCNAICKLEDGVINRLYSINGSVIYGYSSNGKMFFSTTVENQSDELNNKKNLYKYNLGKGIKDWYVEVVRFETSGEKHDLCFKVKKDFLPMLPYQYGLFRFPTNGDCDNLYIFGQAVKKYDQWLINCKIESEEKEVGND